MTNDEIIQQAGTEWNKLRGTMKDYLATVIRIAREDEREACAKVCEMLAKQANKLFKQLKKGNETAIEREVYAAIAFAAEDFSAAIRARNDHGAASTD